VEEIVLANQENAGELLVVVGHHDVLGRALAEAQESMDILNTAESLLPELELNSDVELLESRLQVTLESIGVIEVNSVHLSRILGSGLNMVAEKLAEAAELGLSGVLEAEVESLHGRALVKKLKASIVPEDVENGTVGLPKELQPRGNNGAIGAVPRLLTGDSGKKNGFRGLASLEIVDAGRASGGIDGRLDFISLGLGGSHLLGSELDKFFQNQLVSVSDMFLTGW